MKKLHVTRYRLHICWLYPDHMSTYGDYGNIIVLKKRCTWREISVSISHHTIGSSVSEIKNADILFMGGAQDRQQELVSEDLMKKGKQKACTLTNQIESGVPGLYICGAFQFLGKYYKAADGTKIPGLGVFDMYTKHPGDQKKRLIGNSIIRPNVSFFRHSQFIEKNTAFVGFENHGGRTYLGANAEPFAYVVYGYGNNGEDKTEGVVYKNSIGSYLHGPILPKNPEIADWLIQTALNRKYKESKLTLLDASMEKKSRDVILERLRYNSPRT